MNKTITIAGRTLSFQVILSDESYDRTEFFEGTETYNYKKWILFGKTITKEIPKHVFTISEVITNPNISKKWWEKKILEEIKILERKEQIERGEFI